MNFEIEYIEKLIDVLSDNNLSELSIEDKDDKSENKQAITLKKCCVTNEIVVNNVKTQAIKEVEDKKEENSSSTNESIVVASPVTGTFYASSAPGAEPFVQVGDVVSKGQVLCIVEAMKLMNEIEAEESGKITKICVNDGEMVENGQALMYIE